jgi:hypothetical protein
LKYLIDDEGANLKTKNKFLVLASEKGNKEIVDFLLKNGTFISRVALFMQTKPTRLTCVRNPTRNEIDFNLQ